VKSSIDLGMPCYRYGHFLRECVENVLGQGMSNFRVLILDDASPVRLKLAANARQRTHGLRMCGMSGIEGWPVAKVDLHEVRPLDLRFCSP
jgi:glycosyltransferase involved in cell wall biosynthesis